MQGAVSIGVGIAAPGGSASAPADCATTRTAANAAAHSGTCLNILPLPLVALPSRQSISGPIGPFNPSVGAETPKCRNAASLEPASEARPLHDDDCRPRRLHRRGARGVPTRAEPT